MYDKKLRTKYGLSCIFISVSMHMCKFLPGVKTLNSLTHIWAGVYGIGTHIGGGFLAENIF